MRAKEGEIVCEDWRDGEEVGVGIECWWRWAVRIVDSMARAAQLIMVAKELEGKGEVLM